MYDLLPFPSVTQGNPEKQIAELTSYLIQFKEALEFILTNISVDNLSSDLVEKLNTLGADIERSNEYREEEISQIASRSLTVSDVVNSEVFEKAVTDISGDVEFTVNFDTGNLEYTYEEGD